MLKHSSVIVALVLVLVLSIVGIVSASQSLSSGGLASIERVSRTTNNLQLSEDSAVDDMSPDGRYVLFGSRAPELRWDGNTPAEAQLYLRDTQLDIVYCISLDDESDIFEDGYAGAAVSADGRYVAVVTKESLTLADDNDQWDAYRYDRQEGDWELISCSTSGEVANGELGSCVDMSDDGNDIVFTSSATNLATGDTGTSSDVFIRACALGMTFRLSESASGAAANSWCDLPTISGDGDTVAFISPATNLVTGDTNNRTDVFVTRSVGDVRCASSALDGTIGNGSSAPSTLSMSTDGRYTAFTSSATNLVAQDTNGGVRDVFVYDWITNSNTIVSLDQDDNQLTNACSFPLITGDGSCVLFSTEEQLVSYDGDTEDEFYLRVLGSGDIIRILCTPDDPQLSGYSWEAVLSETGQHVAISYSADDMTFSDTNGCEDVFKISYTEAPGAEPTPTSTSTPGITVVPTFVFMTPGPTIGVNTLVPTLVYATPTFVLGTPTQVLATPTYISGTPLPTLGAMSHCYVPLISR